MNPEIFNSIVTFIVGLVAFIVYRLQKSDEKKNAATIIVMDIRHAEQVVLTILEQGGANIWTKNVLTENNWSKYKHLFVADLSYDDVTAFNRFFDSCIAISDAQIRMREIFDATLKAKASLLQEKIFSIEDLKSEEGQRKKQACIEEINHESYIFEPNEPQQRILQSLRLMGRLTNTNAFEKLKQRAGITS
jgi:hypothetical protein